MKKNQPTQLYFYNKEKNFGDMLNVDLLKDLFNMNVQRESAKKAEMVAIGSLLDGFFISNRIKATLRLLFSPPVTVWGTGFIKEEDRTDKKYLQRLLDIKAVRGRISLERLKKISKKSLGDVVLGDPGLLAGRLIDASKIQKKYRLGIIPHYIDKNNPLLSKINVAKSIIIDIQQPTKDFLKQVAECENILSSAMHGLVVADSLNIPNMRLIVSDKIKGGDYKYNDYYSAFNLSQHQKIDLSKVDFKEKDLETIRKNYQISSVQVNKICEDLIRVFPYPKNITKTK